jgi:hypothetical protein
LPYSEFDELQAMLKVGLKDDYRKQMSLEAFGSWQIIETLKAMLNGKDNKGMSYQEYMEQLGLWEKTTTETNKERLKVEKEKALQKASHIVSLFKQQTGAKK